MRKAMILFVLSLIVFASFGLTAMAQIPKEGAFASTTAYSGTFKILAMGQERAQLTWETMGVMIGESSENIFHNASFRCIGSLHAVKGAFDSNSGFCVATRPDGDQIFSVMKTTGKLRGGAKGVTTLVGGTGKFAGIQGNSEYTQYDMRPSAEGTFQGYNIAKGHYKLP